MRRPCRRRPGRCSRGRRCRGLDGRPAPATISPTTTSTIAIRDSGRHVGAGGTSNETSTSPASSAVSSRIVASRRRSRSTTCSRTGNGLGEGCDACSPASSSETATAWRYRSNRSCELARSAVSRSAWRAFSSIDRPSAETAPRSRSAARGPRQRVAIALELGEGRLALVDAAVRRLDRLLGDLEPAGVLRAPRVQVVERPLELLLGARRCPRSAPLIDAWRRSRSAASSRDRDRSSSWWRTDAVERKNASRRDAGQLGERLVGEGRIGDRPRRRPRGGPCPAHPRNAFSSVPAAIAALVVLDLELEVDRSGARPPPASHGRSASMSAPLLVTLRVRASSIARWIVVLPASFGPWTIVSPGESGISSSR